MNAFHKASKIEKQAEEYLIPFLTEKYGEINKVTDLEEQKFKGDYTYTKATGETGFIELKAEATNKYGNLFLETWSNRSFFTLGWLYKLQADILVYTFVDTKETYVIDLLDLKKWAFGEKTSQGKIYQYPEKTQGKYKQLNDTWGRVVSIKDILENVICKEYHL